MIKITLFISSLLLINPFNNLQKPVQMDHSVDTLFTGSFQETKKFSHDQLTGTYEIKGPGYSIKVSTKEGMLYAEQSWNKSTYSLERSKDNTFTGENNKKFVFATLKEGKVQQLTVTGDRTATFTRKQQ